MAAPRVADAVVWFQDNSQLKVELCKDVKPGDSVLEVNKVVGIAQGATPQTPGMAGSFMQFQKAGDYERICIPMMRVVAVKILEDTGFAVKKDVEVLWESEQ